MNITMTEDNKLTIARMLSQSGVKPTTANVQRVITVLQDTYNSNFEQDIQDALLSDEPLN